MESCEVFYHHVRIIKPPKKKFILCICPKEFLFFFINSDPPPIEVDAGVKITPEDLNCLEYESYVDTSQIIKLDSHGIGETSSRGKIQLPMRKKIVKCARAHGILPGIFMQILESNFR